MAAVFDIVGSRLRYGRVSAGGLPAVACVGCGCPPVVLAVLARLLQQMGNSFFWLCSLDAWLSC